MGMLMSAMREGLSSTQATDFLIGTLYKQFSERDISHFEEFYRAFIDILDKFTSELPPEYYRKPSRKRVEMFFEDWKRASESERKALFFRYIKKCVNLNQLADSILVTGIVTAAIAVKRAGNDLSHLRIINGIPDPILVPSLTLISLVSVKLTRNLLTLWHGGAISADVIEETDEEALSENQTPKEKQEIVIAKDHPQQSSSHLQKVPKDRTRERVPSVICSQDRSRKPSKEAISRSNLSRSSINPKSKLHSSEQPAAPVDEMLSLFSKFESELTLSVIDIQAAMQNVTNALNSGPCILQDPEQVKKLKKALQLISTKRLEDNLSAEKIAIITNFEQELGKLEANFKNAEDIITRALQLQANKEQAEKDFQEAYRLLKEFKAKDDQIKDQIGKLKSELDSIRTAEKENLRKIIDCFESGKFHKDLATKCEMELSRLRHSRERAKKDKADVESAFKNYRQQFT